MKQEQLYRIKWKLKHAPFTTGEGEAVVEKKIADVLVTDMNHKYPNLQHWAEPA